ncbi:MULTISPECIES: PIG-L deacetylase family protein [Ornithinimicrobium]|jgi:LmbE family N-acetylglucosaminyl deacetylase|uniref:PIG-L deacetylase family protein n=1 Tax=Ornithinimicrobium kibberense TaxID=282060 RepID=A0ABV5V1S6_9MICO|nr:MULTISPECIES: PIG-L deacetylase family protein [Ornithinimicrobium]OLT20184.1 GlcNAc-PI de-N-acetylase [Ornithinimicrobium sp. CNJ-824]
MELLPFPTDWRSALVVVAHPDDIEYGTAAAVAAWTAAGKEVTYLLVTRGEAGIDTMPPEEAAEVREQEERAGAREVGVDDVRFLEGFADGVLVGGLELRRALAREIRRVRPDVVITQTYADRFAGGALNQADHRVVGREVLDAVAAAGNRWIFRDLLHEGLDPWSGVRWLGWVGADATHALDVTDHFEAAVRSLEAHREYNAALPDDFPAPRELLTMILGVDHGDDAATGTADVAGDGADRPARYRWTVDLVER